MKLSYLLYQQLKRKEKLICLHCTPSLVSNCQNWVKSLSGMSTPRHASVQISPRYSDLTCILLISPNTHFCMMTSSNGNIFCVTGPLCGEFTGRQWNPSAKASDAKLGYILWSAPWMNGWVKNCEAGDSRRQLAHYDVILMGLISSCHVEPRPVDLNPHTAKGAMTLTFKSKDI